MHIYRFVVGEAVVLTTHRADLSWKVEYIVVAQIKADELEVKYHIRSTDQQYDRVAREHDLSARP